MNLINREQIALNNVAYRNLKEFKKNIIGFREVTKITYESVGGDCKFIADPFIRYDAATEQWLLFVEMAFPARRQMIGVLKSSDLRRWEYHGEVIKGSRESFPYILKHKNYYFMFPCVEVTPVPGFVPIYKATSLLESWKLAGHFELKKLVNDRIVFPSKNGKKYYFVYGTRSGSRPALEYFQFTIDENKGAVGLGKSKVLLRSNIYESFRNKFKRNLRPTMRPAGDLVSVRDGYVLPIQGTYTGKYGECVVLSYIFENENSINVKAIEFVEAKDFDPNWVAIHHISFLTNGDQSVFAVDGHSGKNGAANWEVKIFVNS